MKSITDALKTVFLAEGLEASFRGKLDALYAIGDNFLETLPQPARVQSGLEKIPLRIHSDIVLTSQTCAKRFRTQPNGGTSRWR